MQRFLERNRRIKVKDRVFEDKWQQDLEQMLNFFGKEKEYVFLCIGINKIKGDCLGPFVGTRLKESLKMPVYGTLEENVCYTNIEKYQEILQKKHKGACIIVIDAALSVKEAIGNIYIKKGKTSLGEGLQKEKIELGDISVKGVVAQDCKRGIENFIELSRVSMSQIQALSQLITKGIEKVMKQYE